MAETVAGGADRLQCSPNVACYINVTSALRHNAEAVQKLLFLAEKQLPFVYFPAVHRGMTGPMTQAGAAALVNAGQLAGLVLSQLKQEGAPIIRGAQDGSSLDMRTMVQAYASEYKRAAALDLAHYYQAPTFGWGGTTDSKVLDQQAGIEIALTLFLETLGGANIIHDLGYMESGLTGSLELLAMCDEVVGWLKGAMRGLEINEETLALDLIDEIGPDGHYLQTEHTLRHFRDDWYPRLLDRQRFEDWKGNGQQTMRERAKELVEEILDTREAESLPDEMLEQVKAVRRRAEEKLG